MEQVGKMSTNISFTIDEDLLEAAGTVVPGEKSPLSILKGNGSTIAKDRMARLGSSGVVDANGKAREEYRPVLEALSRARALTTLRYCAGSRLYEIVVSFSGDQGTGSLAVSALHGDHEVTVQSPAAVEEVFTFLDQNIGHSKQASADFSGKFSADEAVALFALADLERSALLHALADETDLKDRAFELPAIIGRAVNRKESFQSLSFVVQSRLGLSAPPQPAQVKSGLKALTDKKLVTQENTKYQLIEALSLVAGRLPVIDGFVTVEIGRLDSNDNLVYASFTALVGGVNDILYFEPHNNGIIVKSISGMQLVGLIAKALTDPGMVKLPAPGRR